MADETRTVVAQIKFQADQQSAAVVRQALDKIEQEIAKKGDATSKRLIQETKAAFASGRMEEATAGIRKLNSYLDDTAKRYQTIRQQVEQTKRSMNELREAGRRLGQVSTAVAGVGAAISGPILLAARSYVDYAGRADVVSRQWLDTTDRISQSQMRIGRVGAQAVMPYLEQAAQIAERVARFLERNPEAMKAAFDAGMVLTLVGTLGLAVSKGIQIYANATTLAAQTNAAAMQLLAARIQERAAAGRLGTAVGQGLASSGGAAAGGAAAGGAGMGGALAVAGAASLAVAIGAGIGLGINEAIARSDWGKEHGIQTGGKVATVGVYQLYKLFGQTEEAALAAAQKVAQFTGEIKNSGDIAQAAAEQAERIIPASAVNAYIAYREAEQQAEERYNEQRNEIVERYAEQRAAIEERYEEQRTSIVERYAEQRAQAEKRLQSRLADLTRNFQEAERKAYEDYQRSRRKAVQDHAREMARMEAEHQKAMRRMEEDYQLERQNAIGSRDALGLANAERQHAVDKQRAEEDYRDARRQRQEDFNRQLGEMDENFRRQREERQKDYQERVAELKAQFEEEQKLRQEQYEKELTALDEKHAEELKKIEAAKEKALKDLDDRFRKEEIKRREEFRKQLLGLGVFHGDQKVLWDKFYADMEQKLRDFIAAMETEASSSSSTQGSRQSGGYVWAGNWRLHDKEFVVNPSTTQALESALGGRLSQDKLLYNLGGGGRFSMNQTVVLNGGGWSEDYTQLAAVIHDATEQSLNEFLRKVHR